MGLTWPSCSQLLLHTLDSKVECLLMLKLLRQVMGPVLRGCAWKALGTQPQRHVHQRQCTSCSDGGLGGRRAVNSFRKFVFEAGCS